MLWNKDARPIVPHRVPFAPPMTQAAPLPADERRQIADSLASMGLIAPGEAFSVARLSGGVSCDVYRIELATRSLCLKRALPKLRVETDWRAPAARSSSEVAWLKLAAQIVPGAVPAVLGEDTARHMFAMRFLPPETHPVWKAELAAGRVDTAFARRVGELIAAVHAATAGKPDIARAFANDAQFRALRLDPFLVYTAGKHPDLADRLCELAKAVGTARIALMHGDVSPKNILCGPDGPVFLDAETASYGDPAFDLAFCLNHLLLKCVWQPRWTEAYLAAFSALATGYLTRVDWEPPEVLKARATRLLPALMLARVDGKSPADYLVSERDRDFVRRNACRFLTASPHRLASIAWEWGEAARRGYP